MDQTIYDEFGNYIGPEIDDEEEEESSIASEVEEPVAAAITMTDVTASRAVVPHEEKKYYPEAHEVYGDVETLVEEEDTQPLTEPIIAPVKTNDFDVVEKTLPVTSFSYEFLSGMMYKPELIRQVCILGHLHSGKTSLVDILVQQTHNDERGKKWSSEKLPRYTDNRKDEIDRGLSVKAVPISLVLPASNEKSYLFHIFDTPGHVVFQDEATAAVRMCDCAVLVIDALTGVMCNTERLLKHALQERLSICVVINCLDRLILELHLPPTDAFFKLRHTIEELNTIAAEHCESLGLPPVRFSPALGNVAFASSLYGFIFTLQSFAGTYIQQYMSTSQPRRGGWMRGIEGTVDPEKFVKCLWGDMYHDAKTGAFSSTPKTSDGPRSFVEFVLNPIYKLFSHTIADQHSTVLHELGVSLKQDTSEMSSRTLLREVCRAFFGDAGAFVDMVVRCCPSPVENATRKVRHCYTGNQHGEVATSMINMDKDGPLMIHVAKSYHRPDCSDFDVLGRIMSGTVYKGQRVKVLGEAFTLEDTEDMEIREVTHLWLYQAGRYRVEVSHVPAGNWVLLGGPSSCITKTATITHADIPDPSSGRLLPSTTEVEIFRPLRFQNKSIIRVSCEPLNPSELPKMLEGFRRLSKSYPLAQTRVEESGEHVVLGTGELYMDCILHDLRKLYGNLEVRIADPVAQFCETVVESSTMKCFAATPNKKNRLHMLVEPLEKGLAEDIEKGTIRWPGTVAAEDEGIWDQKRLAGVLTNTYNWDILAAKSVWAFGPDHEGPNMLIDDTLPGETDKNMLQTVKTMIVQGFQWVTREGPLIEEAVRNCKFRLLDANIASEPAYRGGGQIIPTARRVAYSALLLATPRLMEPVMFVEIECPADCVAAIYTVLAKRRGHVIKDLPKPGTPIYIVHAYIPAIESFGFETDLRTHTSGQAFCLSLFDHWAVVPGDPLSKSIILRPLEPAPAPHLAREFLLKTRRRKGLSENVAVHKFFDDPMLAELAKAEAADLDQYI